MDSIGGERLHYAHVTENEKKGWTCGFHDNPFGSEQQGLKSGYMVRSMIDLEDGGA